MRKRKLSVPLSGPGIKAAVAELRAYSASLDGKADRLCERLAEEGVNAAVAAVRVDTGNLRDGIYYQRAGKGQFLVMSTGEYCWFVEFGTGVVGQGTYEGNLPESWSYDERRTPEAHDPNDPTRWFYYDDKDGGLRSTRGQTANGYMAQAAEEMRQKVLRIAREVFAE